jgi:hypothetical protein
MKRTSWLLVSVLALVLITLPVTQAFAATSLGAIVNV